ncbi:MAG: radical SAM protein [Chloroflexota bacterium]|jgi:radical SAM protein with 4Fe4S-binding SPASM domain|nr:radical SAM protein [Chloroflexota bacterium]
MTSLFRKIKNAFKQTSLPKTGIYHYRQEEGDGKTRLHLRVDPDGSGLLVINADRVVHLNPSAVMMVYLHLEGSNPEEVINVLQKKFEAPASQIRQDYQDLTFKIDELIKPNGACPICDLSLETTLPFSAKLTAPYRMDLALTYRCNNNCSHCYNARPRNYPEMSIDKWKRVIDKIWDLRIPHVVFTGGEPTLFKGLQELVAYAEGKGIITGLNTNGRKLADKSFVNSLVDAGLDHVQITVESHDPEIHDRMVGAKGAWAETIQGLKNVLDSRLYIMTNTTMLTHNRETMEDTLHYLAKLGVPTVGLNALIYAGKGKTVGTGLNEEELPHLLEKARGITQSNGQRLIWYTPTQYCHFNPMQLDLGVKGCTAALYNMCVEPNGDVIPCQSYYYSLGNLLHNRWKEIWEHPLALKLRNRTNVPEECKTCDFFQQCGGGCPLARDHQHIEPIHNPIFNT